ncbi:MAG: hypothetical protein ACI8W8_003051 [Rhodothermales bacterium]|jgi:hypothetical protein
MPSLCPLALLLLLAGVCCAETFRLPLSRDGGMLATAYRQGFHDDNMGGSAVLQLGTAGGGGVGNETRSLLGIDLSGLPERAVAGITLRLFVEGGDIVGHTPFAAELHAISAANAAWVEGTGVEQDSPDDGFTWDSRDGTLAWAGSKGLRTPQVDCDEAVLARSIHSVMPAANAAVDFVFSGDLTALVAGWRASAPSFLLMHPDAASLGNNKRLRFHSREVAEFAPQLIITLEGDGEPVDFAEHVWPIFREHCHGCHGEKKQEGRLRLDARLIALAEVIRPQDAEGSVLMQRVLGHGGARMPDGEEPLSEEAIATLRRWIDQGAIWPPGIGSDAKEVPTHWAYVAPKRPTLPPVADSAWCESPIDFFVLAQLEKRGLVPNPPAARETWLRRVSLDLIGLPPSLAEIDAFLADRTEGAKERVVDRLLASRHFGERWAQPWLDLARYGDSAGIHEDELRATWPWRDWVVQAMNADMPFDQFTIEQLAGDLLPKATEAQRIATGFHRAAAFNTESGTPKEARRTAQVLDRVNVTGTAWLGMTFECAQCHNHKYDPFSQRDYYRFYAYFNQTPDESGPNVGAGRDQMAGPRLKIAGVSTFVMQDMVKPRQTRVFERGDYESPQAKVAMGLPRFLHAPGDDLPANRLGMARWIADSANPLTPRVTVNRWWAALFGAGLVRTGDDFGAQGERPTHPELLDWLAVEFVEGGWSRKQMLRAILLSAAYGQSSLVGEQSLEEDPDCRWLSRAPRLRLSAEGIRDNALAISGLLSRALGGPPVFPPQPEGLWWIRDAKSPKYETSHGESRYRRGLYTIWRRTYLHPSMAVFDAPGRVTCSVDRVRTNTPLQALTLLNDPIHLEAAFGLARRLADMTEEPNLRIAHAFRLATARKPSAAESATLLALYQGQRARYLGDAKSARELLEAVRGDLAAGVSLFETEAAAELAAWFQLASVLLNLDETITRG